MIKPLISLVDEALVLPKRAPDLLGSADAFYLRDHLYGLSFALLFEGFLILGIVDAKLIEHRIVHLFRVFETQLPALFCSFALGLADPFLMTGFAEHPGIFFSVHFGPVLLFELLEFGPSFLPFFSCLSIELFD